MSSSSRSLLLRIYDLSRHGGGLASPQMQSFAVAVADVDGPVLGLDVGIRHIGVALSDAGRQISFSQLGFRRGAVREDIERIQEVTRRAAIRAAVVGMPVAPVGHECLKLQEFVRGYSQTILAACGVEVIGFWDESFTTKLAKDAFMKRSRKRARNSLSLRKRTVDAVCYNASCNSSLRR